MATLTVKNSTYSSTSTSITITFTTDVTPTAVKLTKDGTNWITATTYTSNSATFNVSSWGKGTFTNCQLKVSYVEESSGGGVPESPLNISNIIGGTFTISNNATITYTTNKAVTKHEYRMNKSYAYSDGTDKVTSSGNNHTLTFNAGELSAGTKNGSIRVTDANGNTAEADFTMIINEVSSTSYTITKNLTNCTCSNSASSITSGSSYSATITANSEYELSSITVSMGGTDISSSAVSGNSISISSVTGNIVITANATQTSGGVEPIEPIDPTLAITNITGGTFNADWSIPYTTNKPVIKHYYSTWYQGSDSATSWMDRTGDVTDNGNNSYSMAFKYSDFTPGTKNPAIKVVDADGNIAIKTFTLVIAENSPTTYTITKNLSNCSCSNSAGSITSGASYSATITANSGYTLSSLTVTMGGANITSSAVSGSSISISNVTGNIVITASATQQETPSAPSSGSALDDWDAFHNTYGNYVAYMADRVGVKGKAIRMTATRTATTVQGSVKKDYRSGAMVSKKAFKYGTFTFKFKISANNTLLWPMIWTLPDQTAAQDQLIGKNQRPEYDLLESWGAMTNNSVVQTYHCTTPAGESKMNYLQGRTPVDLTQEHELKLVWTQDNVVKMYCDGVVKVTIKDYVTNWRTGEVDYQVWFLNLGLGGFDGTAPNGTGWFEITDYDFQPVYSRDRVKQDYGFGRFSDGTLPSGPLPSSGGGSTTPDPTPTPTTYTITKNLTNCVCRNSASSISEGSTYNTTINANSGYSLSTITVTMGGTDITSSAVTSNTISIGNVTGNIVITASATETSSGVNPDAPITITNITVLSSTEASTQINYTTNKAVTKHYFNMWYSGADSGFTDAGNKVTDNGNNNYTMTFVNQLSAGTKTPAIKVKDAEGNTAIKAYDLTVTS